MKQNLASRTTRIVALSVLCVLPTICISRVVEEQPLPTEKSVEIAPELGALREGTHIRGFTVAATYLDEADRPIGAKLVHDKTGFTLDYLKIESAPQGYIWVNSYPTSDQGEPHTQEHLLLGKGNRGRRLGSSEAMALATSSAFTEQWHTAYHFHTVAGSDVYWSVFENQLDNPREGSGPARQGHDRGDVAKAGTSDLRDIEHR